jgi:ABC-type branched-subunit amino acid transport system permease subunit
VGGLTSFGQAAFVGLGAYSTAYLTTATDLPAAIAWMGGSPWAGLIVGLLLTAMVASVLGLLTLRLSGHYLPLGTIAWGISIFFLFGNVEFLGGHTGISGIPALSLAGFELKDPRSFYYLIWAVVLAAAWATSNLLDSREGRAIRALKGGGLMAEAMGVNTARSKLVIFVIAALLASVSGWLYAHMQRFINPTPFGLHIGIEYLFMAVIGGATQVWGALVGAGLITLLKEWLQDLLPRLLGASGNFEVIVFGLLMILVLHKARDGLWVVISRRVAVKSDRRKIGSAEPLPARERPEVGTVLLEVKDVVKKFGGLTANNQMSLAVGAGEILALIGPNGAGKSTLFNAITGVDGPTSGEVRFRGQRVDGMSPHVIARLGMSRTFQHVRLLPAMSALENVAIGAHLRGVRGVLAAALHSERGEETRPAFGQAADPGNRPGAGGGSVPAAARRAGGGAALLRETDPGGVAAALAGRGNGHSASGARYGLRHGIGGSRRRHGVRPKDRGGVA